MSSNLPLVRRSRRVLPWSGGLKLEINIPSQQIRAKWKGGLINEGGVISSEYGTTFRQKWGGGVCSNIQFVSCIRPLPPFLAVLLLESAALVLILSQEAPKQLASCVVTRDDSAQARVPNASNKNLSGGEETRRQ